MFSLDDRDPSQAPVAFALCICTWTCICALAFEFTCSGNPASSPGNSPPPQPPLPYLSTASPPPSRLLLLLLRQSAAFVSVDPSCSPSLVSPNLTYLPYLALNLASTPVPPLLSTPRRSAPLLSFAVWYSALLHRRARTANGRLVLSRLVSSRRSRPRLIIE